MNALKCRLLSIRCYKSSEGDGDEVYLKLNGKKIWPQKETWQKLVNDGETRVGITLPNEKQETLLTVDLYDYDSLLDDKLGSFKLDLTGSGGSFSTDLSSAREGARYSLSWEAYR